jgi:hypothetical protein
MRTALAFMGQRDMAAARADESRDRELARKQAKEHADESIKLQKLGLMTSIVGHLVSSGYAKSGVALMDKAGLGEFKSGVADILEDLEKGTGKIDEISGYAARAAMDPNLSPEDRATAQTVVNNLLNPQVAAKLSGGDSLVSQEFFELMAKLRGRLKSATADEVPITPLGGQQGSSPVPSGANIESAINYHVEQRKGLGQPIKEKLKGKQTLSQSTSSGWEVKRDQEFMKDVAEIPIPESTGLYVEPSSGRLKLRDNKPRNLSKDEAAAIYQYTEPTDDADGADHARYLGLVARILAVKHLGQKAIDKELEKHQAKYGNSLGLTFQQIDQIRLLAAKLNTPDKQKAGSI